MANVTEVTDIDVVLRGMNGTSSWQTVEVLGYYTPGDGGGGTFTWESGVTSGNNDGTIIVPSTPTGRWIRRYNGPINVRWFGAKGDGLSDDTIAVHKARDQSLYGTIYFPSGTYRGQFVMASTGIIGDGYSSVLQTMGGIDPISSDPLPVLTLGWRIPHWQFVRIFNIKIDGTYTAAKFCDGVRFDTTSQGELAGRWVFENVTIENCKKAVFKPKGNIGNSFTNCLISRNDFGFYALNASNMHAGCDRFVGGLIEKNSLAGIFIKSNDLYGQLILDGTVVEQNAGFGIFVKLTGGAQMTFCAIEIRDVWMEANTSSSTNVVIDGITYAPSELRDMRFEGVRSVSISGSLVRDITLVGSSVNLYNCRVDDAYWKGTVWEGVIDVDDSSSIVARELRYATPTSEKVFVESISYDGTCDIWNQPKLMTSVWGPLRTTLMSGLSNVVFTSAPQTELGYEEWNIYNETDTVNAIDVADAGTMINYSDSDMVPQLQIVSKQLTLYQGQIVYSPGSFIVEPDKYYFWSIHAYLCEGSVKGWFGDFHEEGPNALGQVIFKSKEWTCSYGIKRFTETEEFTEFRLWFKCENSPMEETRFRFCHYQVLKFDLLSEAISYMNGKGVAFPGSACAEG